MKDYSRIMRSTSIYEIDAFLKDAHPDDPKRLLLKPRLIKLLKEYIKNAHPADQRVPHFQEKIALLYSRPSTKIGFEEMNEIIKQKQIAKFEAQLAAKNYAANLSAEALGESSALLDSNEQEEFLMLMSVSPMEHKNKTVQILNSLFDNDPTSKESIVMIENKSNCNMIMRIEGVGNTKYRLAVPTQAEGSIVVQKGSYLFTTKVCGADYASQKSVQKALIVSLNNPGK
ncbi:DUF6759 domain-containing protein [Kaistella polysaccharea]|uniref:DUF6759 domain-containing protein n=1 Tax=Kaistella polysaccharea TaxID=2878534 RepID=UPI001CF3517B|nr:DUF6759 domain-containing protein [Kaistella polysaccharea]